MTLFLNVITAVAVLLTAAKQLLFPGKGPTSRFGYRSTLALMNVATWIESQRISGRAMVVAGFVGLIASVACYRLIPGRTNYVISMVLSAVFAAMCVPYTEYKLSRIFDEKGKRKPL
jgi:uncharacterized membrane protein